MTHEHEPREVEVDTAKFSDLNLGYAVHVYKAQGITAEASGILTGGWQTDRESAYVALSRAREQTRVYVSREDLGEAGAWTPARLNGSASGCAAVAHMRRASPRKLTSEARSVRSGSNARSTETATWTAALRSSERLLRLVRTRPPERSSADARKSREAKAAKVHLGYQKQPIEVGRSSSHGHEQNATYDPERKTAV